MRLQLQCFIKAADSAGHQPLPSREGGERPSVLVVDGRPVELTPTEYELLRILSVNAGRVMTCNSLIRKIWNSPDAGDPDRVRTFVKQLRRKPGNTSPSGGC